LGTFFSCTNASTSTIQVGVELFGSGGGGPLNNASTTSVSLAAGATVMFGTAPAVGLGPDVNLASGTLVTGSARIVATSKSLVCNALLADKLNSPPVSMTYLTIVAKAKQKAAN